MPKQSFHKISVVDPKQIRMARSGLGLSIRDLANRTGINKATIVRLEAGSSVRSSTIGVVRRALEAAGADFLLSDDAKRIAISISKGD